MVFWVAVLLACATMALVLTGDLLSWDQNGYWATHVRVSFLNLIPGIGPALYKLAVGGASFGHLTLTRFFALHAGLFTAVFAGLAGSWSACFAARQPPRGPPRRGRVGTGRTRSCAM